MLDDSQMPTYRSAAGRGVRGAKAAKPAALLADATAAAATAIAVQLQSLATAGAEDRRWMSVREQFQAEWPVEGGSPDDVIACTAMLIAMKPSVDWMSRGTARSAGFDDRMGAMLDGCLAVAQAHPPIAQILHDLRKQSAVWLPAIVAPAGSNADEAPPLAMLYENVLTRVQRKQRTARGVFHTPMAVVDWMVEAVGSLVDRHFGDERTSVRIIDAGCSCGTFLSAAARSERLQACHPKLMGYEVLPAAWGLCHWLLAGTADVRWCNPLLAGEAEAARIVGDGRLPIFIGNPPYSNFGRQNCGPWINSLLADYRREVAERKLNLADDYIKFIRWSQHWVDRAGRGIVALVTSSTYLRGLTQRGMRASLLRSFDELHFVDLHGEADKSDDASDDENIFPIRSGVAIALLVKHGRGNVKSVRYRSVCGSRKAKFAWLRGNTYDKVQWQTIEPQAPNLVFIQATNAAHGTHSLANYGDFWPLTSIFQHYISGVQTKNDALLVDFDRNTLAARIEALLKSAATAPSNKTPIEFDCNRIVPYLLAPFDRRWLYYDPRLIGRARESVLRHMLRPNVGLVFMRQSSGAGEYDHVLAVDCLVSDRVFYSRHGAPYCAPLWLYADDADKPPTANLQPAWVAALREAIGRAPTGEEAFDYVYAVMHRRDYREAFAAELRIDFPRIPLPSSNDVFAQHARVGKQFRALHTEPPSSETLSPAARQAAEHVTIGGYAVLKRWRKPRNGHRATLAISQDEAKLSALLHATKQLKHSLDAIQPAWAE